MSRKKKKKKVTVGGFLKREAKEFAKEFGRQIFGGRPKKRKTIAFYNGRPVLKIENGKYTYY